MDQRHNSPVALPLLQETAHCVVPISKSASVTLEFVEVLKQLLSKSFHPSHKRALQLNKKCPNATTRIQRPLKIMEKGGIHKAKAEFSEAQHGEGPCPPPEDVSEQFAGVPNHEKEIIDLYYRISHCPRFSNLCLKCGQHKPRTVSRALHWGTPVNELKTLLTKPIPA